MLLIEVSEPRCWRDGAAWLAIAAISLAVLLVACATAQAGRFGSEYSFGGDQCNSPVDPVTTVFFGSGAAGEYLTRDGKGHIHYHTGWKHHSHEKSQWHSGPSGCIESLTHQPAEAFGFPNSRYHIRLFRGPTGYRDRRDRHVKLGTAHHEDWVQRCNSFAGGHAVDKGAVDRGPHDRTNKGSGFDRGRRRLANRFSFDPRGSSGRHPIFYANWGNTRSKKQCDGEWAGSNGKVAWIGVGRY